MFRRLNHPVWAFSGSFICYFLIARLGLLFRTEPDQFAIFWPPNGWLLGLLLITQGRQRQVILGGAGLACILANLSGGNSVPVSLGFTVVNMAEPIIAAWVLLRVGGGRFRVSSPGDVLQLYFVALCVCLISALGGTAVITHGLGVPDPVRVYRLFLLADAISVVLVTPVILVWAHAPAEATSLRPKRAFEAACCVILISALTLLIFGESGGSPWKTTSWAFPVVAILIWPALRFGLRGTATGVLVVSLIAIWNTGVGRGPFATVNASAADQLLAVQYFLSVLSLSSLSLAAALEQREEYRQQLLETGKTEAIGQLAGSIAHDFNNIMTVVNCVSETLMLDPTTTPEQKQQVEEIYVAGRKAADLTGQLMTIGRKQTFNSESVDLNALITHMYPLLTRLAGNTISIETDLQHDLHSVSVDSRQLERVIVNLIVNAREAMPDGGAVLLTTMNLSPGDGRGRVRLSIRDDGIGMTRDVLRRIFEPHFTTRKAVGGTGLGLASSRGIIQQCGGQLEVESAAGEESVFHITLPGSGKAAEPNREVISAQVDREVILLVDDEESIRRSVGLWLERHGYHVLPAADGEEALELSLQHERIDLLLTDLTMPGLNGRRLASEMLAARPLLPVILMSGHAPADQMDGWEDFRQVHFVQKPFLLPKLTESIRGLLDSRGDEASEQRRAG